MSRGSSAIVQTSRVQKARLTANVSSGSREGINTQNNNTTEGNAKKSYHANTNESGLSAYVTRRFCVRKHLLLRTHSKSWARAERRENPYVGWNPHAIWGECNMGRITTYAVFLGKTCFNAAHKTFSLNLMRMRMRMLHEMMNQGCSRRATNRPATALSCQVHV